MFSEEKTDEQSEQPSARDLPRFLKVLIGREPVSIKGKRRGFLPFDTNPFDRVFVSIMLTVAIHLLWMRFLEEYIALTVATILTLILTVIIVVRG